MAANDAVYKLLWLLGTPRARRRGTWHAKTMGDIICTIYNNQHGHCIIACSTANIQLILHATGLQSTACARIYALPAPFTLRPSKPLRSPALSCYAACFRLHQTFNGQKPWIFSLKRRKAAHTRLVTAPAVTATIATAAKPFPPCITRPPTPPFMFSTPTTRCLRA